MGSPAVPEYLDKHLSEGTAAKVAPGLRFGPLFSIWKKETWDRDDDPKNKTGALREVTQASSQAGEVLEALCMRQEVLADSRWDNRLQVSALSHAPFMTGIGNEHPLENGFSFMPPYGLPYLPGSAVKGVLRRAAEDLSLGLYGDCKGWDFLSVWYLFGFDASNSCLTFLSNCENRSDHFPDDIVKQEAEKHHQAYVRWASNGQYDRSAMIEFMRSTLRPDQFDYYQTDPGNFLWTLALPAAAPSRKDIEARKEQIHYQGALAFWDVFPRPEKGKKEEPFLKMEILTPHYEDYYQGNNTGTPADCGQPKPNPFLTVAPGCKFDFNIQCDQSRLPKFLKDNWKTLILSALEHAFQWLGFGAKTAVGYGQMSIQPSAKKSRPGKPEEPKAEVPSPEPIEVWEQAQLSYRPNEQSLTAKSKDGNRTTAPLKNFDRAIVPERLQKKLFKDRKPVEAKVTVSVNGNHIRIKTIE